MFCQSCGANLNAAAAAPRPVATASAAPRARLVVIAQDGSSGHEYAIESGQIEIGRDAGNVRLEGDVYACPRHARIYWKNDRFWVSDLGSVNGVYARLTESERLHHGDLLLIGLEVLRFEIVSPGEASPAPAIERGTRLFGSPSSPRYARIVERTVEGITRNVYYLSKLVTTLGRETGDIVFTDDPFMSRQHAALSRQEDGTFAIKDLGSSNGTFIAIRDERPLPDGGHVRIGQHLFRLKVDR
jgi:pSer/pThr/pTyr-binding forkhead associated (FHA) protein